MLSGYVYVAFTFIWVFCVEQGMSLPVNNTADNANVTQRENNDNQHQTIENEDLLQHYLAAFIASSPWSSWGPCEPSCGPGRQDRSRLSCGSGCNDTSIGLREFQTRRCFITACHDGNWLSWSLWQSCSVTCGAGVVTRSRNCDGTMCEGRKQEEKSCDGPTCPALWNCINKQADLIFMIDSSRSIRASNPADGSFDNWDRVLSIPINIIQRLTKQFRFSFINFAKHSYIGQKMASHKEKGFRYFLRNIRAIKHKNESCRMALALQNLQDAMFVPSRGDRTHAPNIALLITDDGTKITNAAISVIEQIKRDGTLLLILGLTKKMSGEDLVGIASSDKSWWISPSYKVDHNVIGNIVHRICSISTSVSRWSSWNPWSPCSTSCGSGVKSRTRTCLSRLCQEHDSETNSCFVECGWGPWLGWSPCTDPCGGGTQRRTRQCSGQTVCQGRSEDTRICNNIECPEVRVQEEWGPWSSCNATCEGRKIRIRPCTGEGCVMEKEVVQCGSIKCPSEWGDWGSWGACSTSCDPGIRSRLRQCHHGLPGSCPGDHEQTGQCNIKECPVSPWVDWAECSVTCGGGIQTRLRECDGQLCDGNNEATRKCNLHACPEWTDWGSWGACSTSCDPGIQYRLRQCHNGIPGSCQGDHEQTKICNIKYCPVKDWGDWGECSVTCGGGIQTRLRECDGQPCDGNNEATRKCNVHSCPEWTDWGSWTACSRTCDPGIRYRDRQCHNELHGSCPGDHEQTEQCNIEDCPVWGSWGGWEACSVTCGQGVKSRHRECKSGDCGGPTEQTDTCQVHALTNLRCIGEWTEWERYGDCSPTCGAGRQKWIRICLTGSDCLGDQTEKETHCSVIACNGSREGVTWSVWQDWGSCSVTCNTGIQTRKRSCPQQGKCGASGNQTMLCKMSACVGEWLGWMAWTDCPSMCVTKVRKRLCDGQNCPGEDSEVESCGKCVTMPPMWTSWDQWDECTESCGHGHQHRERTCQPQVIEGEPPPVETVEGCPGEDSQTRQCNTGSCWSDWTSWTPCSVTCGSGIQSHNRTCQAGSCDGEDTETRECSQLPCRKTTVPVDCNSFCQNPGTKDFNINRNQCYCLCKPGFAGFRCQRDVCNECFDVGTNVTLPEFGECYCLCNPGFSGFQCQTDMCVSCQDPGTRSKVRVPHDCKCHCNDGYGGDSCQNDLCLPCQKKGTYHRLRGPGTCSCVCKPGFYGETCANDVCQRCVEAGTNQRVPTEGGCNCTCNEGYTGHRCQTAMLREGAASPQRSNAGLIVFYCTFDYNLCGLVQRIDDDFDWVRHSTSSGSNNGPATDHTGTGFFIYADSTQHSPGETTKLRFPRISIKGALCLSFWYYMGAFQTGTLAVEVTTTTVTQDVIIWTRAGNHGNTWKKAHVDLPPDLTSVSFRAVLGSYHSDISIDDVFIVTGTCPG